MPGILGYDRFINSDGNAEFNLILMDYRANNDGKIHNKNKRSGQIEVNVGRVDTMCAKSSVWGHLVTHDLKMAHNGYWNYYDKLSQIRSILETCFILPQNNGIIHMPNYYWVIDGQFLKL